MALFTPYQIRQLARCLVEDQGSTLSDAELAERIGLMLEDIAGCDLASDSDLQHTIAQLRSTYYDLTGQNR